MKRYIAERPWIWIWVAFAVLIASLGYMVQVATNNRPQEIPLNAPANHAAY